MINDTIEPGSIRVRFPCEAVEHARYCFTVYADVTPEQWAELQDPEYDVYDWLLENEENYADYIDYRDGASTRTQGPRLDYVGDPVALEPGDRALTREHRDLASAVHLVMSKLPDRDAEAFEQIALQNDLLRRCRCGWNVPVDAAQCEECGQSAPGAD